MLSRQKGLREDEIKLNTSELHQPPELLPLPQPLFPLSPSLLGLQLAAFCSPDTTAPSQSPNLCLNHRFIGFDYCSNVTSLESLSVLVSAAVTKVP